MPGAPLVTKSGTLMEMALSTWGHSPASSFYYLSSKQREDHLVFLLQQVAVDTKGDLLLEIAPKLL